MHTALLGMSPTYTLPFGDCMHVCPYKLDILYCVWHIMPVAICMYISVSIIISVFGCLCYANQGHTAYWLIVKGNNGEVALAVLPITHSPLWGSHRIKVHICGYYYKWC